MDYKARAALERVRKALMMRDAGYDAAPDAEDCALLVAALTPPAETGESDLSYVPIVGAGVDALDRRDPEAMAKISKQLKSWKCWPTTPPAQAEIGEAKKVLAPFYKTVDVMKSAHQRGTLMCIWDDDISAIEGVMLYLEKLRDAEKIRR